MKIDFLIKKLNDAQKRVGYDAEVMFYHISDIGKEGIMPFEVEECLVSESEETVFIMGTPKKFNRDS